MKSIQNRPCIAKFNFSQYAMFSVDYFFIYFGNNNRNFDISKTPEKLIERPLNKRGKIDIDMEVSSHDAAKG